MLRQMRHMARWGGLGLWLWEMDTRAAGAAGFVWMEKKRVVGNVSLRQASSPGGWMIGNVAVHPDWQGRGIGRALVDTAVNTAQEYGGAWVGLEVREDNAPACQLYERIGFAPVGSALDLSRSAGLPWPPAAPSPLPLRRANAADNAALYQLAVEGLSQPLRELLEVRPALYQAGWEARLNRWLEGCREGWWKLEEENRLVGALRTSSRFSLRWHTVEALVRQERLDDVGPRLIAAGLEILSHRRPWEVTTMLPEPRQALEAALTAVGFRRARCLVQMRLTLGRPVEIAAGARG